MGRAKDGQTVGVTTKAEYDWLAGRPDDDGITVVTVDGRYDR